MKPLVLKQCIVLYIILHLLRFTNRDKVGIKMPFKETFKAMEAGEWSTVKKLLAGLRKDALELHFGVIGDYYFSIFNITYFTH